MMKGMQLPGVSSATGQTGLGLGLTGGAGGLGRTGGQMNLNQTQTSTGLRLGGIGNQLATTGIGMGQSRPISLGLGKPGTGMGGMGTGLGAGMGLGAGGMGTGLGTGGMGTGLGTGGMGTGLGTGGLGTGLGAGGMGTGLGTGGLGTSLGAGGLGTGLGAGGMGTGLGAGGMGTGLGAGGIKPGIGTGLGPSSIGAGGLGMGLQNKGTTTGGAGGLGGLSLAGTQRGPTQGIFTQTANVSQTSSQQQLINAQLMLSAITMPGLFGDERDLIIKKFNQLEAYCGFGKGLTSCGGQATLVEFSPNNPFARFKTICYSKLPTTKNEDGLVALQFNKSDTELLETQETLTKKLQDIVGNTSVQVVIDSIKPLPDSHSEVTIYILEQSALGSLGKVLSTSTYVHLQNATRKSQLESIGVIGIYPKTGFSEDELKLYLSTPPAGVTSDIWEQCKKENPDPQHYIPVVIVGSEELLKRIKCQKQECEQHAMRLKIMSDEMNELQQLQVTAVARIAEYRRRLNDLSHRILKVMVTQEKYRKLGWSVQPVEEQLRGKLEAIIRELESPTLLKGRLNEIMSQLRMQGHHSSTNHSSSKNLMDSVLADDIKDHLTQQQGALSDMIKIVKNDYEDLKLVESGLKDMSQTV